MIKWELRQCKESGYTPDNSGVYVVINRIAGRAKPGLRIRVDVMSCDDKPLMGFVGPANAVRKDVIRWLEAQYWLSNLNRLSTQHVSYIGYEIARAAADENFVQD